MKRRTLGLLWKEVLQLRRDVIVLIFVLYAFVEIALCGWALTLEVRNIPMAVYDGDQSAESRSLIEAFDRLQSFSLTYTVKNPGRIDLLLEKGEAQVGMVIPAGYSRSLASAEAGEVQLLFDGSHNTIASQALADAYDLLRDYNTKLTMSKFEQSGMGGGDFLPQVRNQVRIWYNPELKYVYFVMVVMLTTAVLVTGMLIPAASIVREKEAGTLEQLMVTPITSTELITAKTLPTVFIKLIGVTVGLGVTLWVFDVPVRGDLLLFYALSLAATLSTIGIGVLIGTFADNLQQALLIGFFIFFPMSFLSGTTTPIEMMALPMQWLSYLSPLRYYVAGTLDIFIKGVGFEVVWPQFVGLLSIGLVMFVTSVLRLRRSLA